MVVGKGSLLIVILFIDLCLRFCIITLSDAYGMVFV